MKVRTFEHRFAWPSIPPPFYWLKRAHYVSEVYRLTIKHKGILDGQVVRKIPAPWGTEL